MTLFAFSMPPATPITMMARETTSATICHTPLPMPKKPADAIALRASGRVSASGAVMPNVPPIAPMSVPRLNRLPERDMKVYLKIQPRTTV